MALISLDRHSSVVLAVDIQENFMKSVWESDRVISRAGYLLRVAKTLEIPVIATTQYSKRLGELHPGLGLPTEIALDKLTFSCARDSVILDNLQRLGRRQVVIVGVETHICVCFTVNDLIQQGFQVVVCPDAVSSSTMERHKLGMERIRDAGGVPSHTEGVSYEWLESAGDPKFREVLQLTKDFH